jgi:photosystem II stability/assembly factor-like uncharacterized protein
MSGIAVQDEDTIYVSSPRFFGQTPGIVFKTTTSGLSWDTTLYNAGTSVIKMHPHNPAILYVGVGGLDPPYGILKTTDGGGSWFHADSGIVANGKRGVVVIEFDSVHPETLYAGTAGFFPGDMYKSTNGGENWTSVGGSGLYGGIASIVIDPISTDTIYAGGASGQGLFKSTDGGSTWQLTTLPVGGSGVNGLGIDPMNTSIIYAGLGNIGFYRSTDAGTSWAEATTGMPQNTAVGFVEVNQITRQVFAAVLLDSVALFKSTDQAVTWTRMGGLDAAAVVSALTTSPDQSHLYVGINNLGVYRINILVSDVPDDRTSLPVKATLLQSYPNPFNPTTTIKYDLPTDSPVSLKVYDVLGREVLTLVEGVERSGSHEVVLNASDLSSGVYFYRLKAGDFTNTRRLLLLK